MKEDLFVLFLFIGDVYSLLEPMYILGAQGDNCVSTCGSVGRGCLNSGVITDDSDAIFKKLGVNCNKTVEDGKWWAADQPSFVSDPLDPNSGACLGYKKLPESQGSFCQASYWSVQRVCACGQDVTRRMTFGTGYSGGHITRNETTMFMHIIDSSLGIGVMNHFWTTCSPECERDAIFRFYIDGETKPSIAFSPAMAAGTGFDDTEAPWGTKWFGLGAGNGAKAGQAWFNNFKIPFGKSIRVTIQHKKGEYNGFYLILRGAIHQTNTALRVGDLKLPTQARLHLQTFEGPLKPLQYLDIATAPAGTAGVHFMSTLSVENAGKGRLNFLEGCYHMYSPPTEMFPGVVLATGTEDYFDSGWYFNAGKFHLPVSGFTHLLNNASKVEWSAYRFHDTDPLRFSDGFRLTWRCGDALSAHTGLKCYTESGGLPVGTPTCDNVISYAWVYTWPNTTRVEY